MSTGSICYKVQKREMHVKELGLIAYQEALAVQETFHQKVVNQKKDLARHEKNHSDYLIVCQHLPVYTIGRNGLLNQLLVEKAVLEKQAIELYHVNRGGGITYHGPGQLIVYPIVDLEIFCSDIHCYLRLLEDAVIELLSCFHIPSLHLPGLTGVWLPADNKQLALSQKICSIGIRISRWVTMHGLALNINNDLAPFHQILPCGMTQPITSMEQVLKKKINFDDVSDLLQQILLKKLNYHL